MRLRLFAVALGVLFSFAFARPAAADTTLSLDLVLPFSETVLNNCNSEMVALSGSQHIVDVVTLRDDGSQHHKFHQNEQLTGIGTLLNTYLANQTEDNEYDTPPGVSANFVSTFVAVNQTDPKLSMKLIVSIHFNTQSTTFMRDNIVTKCNPIIS
jgi:hypothetical protein